MRVTHRPFRYHSQDFQQMCQLLRQQNRQLGQHYHWHIGRLQDWLYGLWREEKYFPHNFSANAELWFNPYQELAGFVLSEDFDHRFSCFARDDQQAVYASQLAWVKAHWHRRGDKLKTEIPEYCQPLRAALEDTGFSFDGITEQSWLFDTADFAGYRCPDPELYITTLEDEPDHLAQATLKVNAFNNKAEPDRLDLQAFANVRSSQIYDSGFDFVLKNRDGQTLAGCEAFVCPGSGIAEIERVCTHRQHWNLGYASMTIRASLAKLARHGIVSAQLTGWDDKTNAIYSRIGHRGKLNRLNFIG